MASRARLLLAIGFGVLASAPGVCAGGAHVVDDSAVEDPGTCHFENWLSLLRHGAGLFNISPACTPRALPRLELGGAVTHSWSRTDGATLVGLTTKFNLRPEEKELGVALSGSLGLSADHGRLESASLIVPFTIPAGDRLRFNLDTGWQWLRGQTHALFIGAQTEIAATRDLSLMVEGFARTINKPGGQVGLRWTPHQGKVDLDLIAGRHVDGVGANQVTLGLTVRI